MFDLFKEIRALEEAGKLHKSLILRIRMLFIVSAVLGLAVLYNVVFRGANPWVAAGLSVVGFATGIFMFAKMNAVTWNEAERVVQTGRMDAAGFLVLGFYVGFEILFRTLIKDIFPADATAFVLAAVFGTLFGRAVGTLIEIHRVYRITRSAKK